MQLLERVKQDSTAALKAGDRELAGALRMVVAALQQAHKDEDDADEVAVLQRERKRRLEAATSYRDGGRTDLAEGEEREAALIEGYLPEQLADDDLARLVDEAVAESGASEPKDMGRVMSVLMPRVGGRADGRRVSAAVKERLTG